MYIGTAQKHKKYKHEAGTKFSVETHFIVLSQFYVVPKLTTCTLVHVSTLGCCP